MRPGLARGGCRVQPFPDIAHPGTAGILVVVVVEYPDDYDYDNDNDKESFSTICSRLAA